MALSNSWKQHGGECNFICMDSLDSLGIQLYPEEFQDL